ncbi:glycosyltransferase [Aurantimonas sp. Leaf443]|uniref:glycosyltransferase n=1 Tax=Aurantimonas sp. Leaf443 TaxID=1736378 RepID=UPI0006F5EF35|nr:glycosyltransferase [Aurantimonas sp. Leaf443]KQT83369.1 hypothetical protein ASG48_12435 [Aurantimonas sp. Leaf443]
MKIAFDVKLPVDRLAGVEKQFANFLVATRNDPRIETHLFDRALEARHQLVVDALDSLAAPPFDARRLGKLVVPKPLRIGRQARYARRMGLDVIVNINRFPSINMARIAAKSGTRSVYWERGASWFPQEKAIRNGFASAYDVYLANSHAARAMLQTLWHVSKPIEILAPAVWEIDALPPMAPRVLDASRPLRLGFAGRLRAFKGGVLAVHTMSDLRRKGIETELVVAGTGDDVGPMRAQAEALGIADAVRFLGSITDMAGFYEGIDILLHPALREPYGNVIAEAQSFGVPAVVSRIDGMPDVIEEGRTGHSVPANAPIDAFVTFGANGLDVYPQVFHPEDRAPGASAPGLVGPPRFPWPGDLADAVASLVASPEAYRGFSERAMRHARASFSPAVHIDTFIAHMRKAAAV